MIKRKSWASFRSSGMLFFVNTILHAFGWCLVARIENGKIVEMYPARTKFRGFSDKVQDDGHIKIAKYLSKNAHKFPEEIK